MNGLTNRQESALARIWMTQDSLPADLTNWGIADDLVVLRDCGMIDMQTDMSHTLAFVQRLLSEGREHYQSVRKERKQFVNLRDPADELIGRIAADYDASGGIIPPKYYGNRIDDYRSLSKAGLLKITWADNEPYHVEMTDKGWEYIEGNFPKEDRVLIDFRPVVQGGSATASANASATTSNAVSLGMSIGSIIDLDDINEELKQQAQDALKKLDEAAKSENKADFAEKLERAASIAKSASTLAGAMLPFFQTAIQHFLG